MSPPRTFGKDRSSFSQTLWSLMKSDRTSSLDPPRTMSPTTSHPSHLPNPPLHAPFRKVPSVSIQPDSLTSQSLSVVAVPAATGGGKKSSSDDGHRKSVARTGKAESNYQTKSQNQKRPPTIKLRSNSTEMQAGNARSKTRRDSAPVLNGAEGTRSSWKTQHTGMSKTNRKRKSMQSHPNPRRNSASGIREMSAHSGMRFSHNSSSHTTDGFLYHEMESPGFNAGFLIARQDGRARSTSSPSRLNQDGRASPWQQHRRSPTPTKGSDPAKTALDARKVATDILGADAHNDSWNGMRSASPVPSSQAGKELETVQTKYSSLLSQFETLQSQYQTSQTKVSQLGIKLQEAVSHISHLQQLNSLQHTKMKQMKKRLHSKNLEHLKTSEESRKINKLESEVVEERESRFVFQKQLQDVVKERDEWKERCLELEKQLWKQERYSKLHGNASRQQHHSAVVAASSGDSTFYVEEAYGNQREVSSGTAHSTTRTPQYYERHYHEEETAPPLLSIRSKQLIRPLRGASTESLPKPRPLRLKSASSATRRRFSSADSTRSLFSAKSRNKQSFKMYRRASEADQGVFPRESLKPWGTDSPSQER